MKHRRGCPLFTHPTQRPPGHPTDCRCPALTPETQTERLVRYLRANPGASTMELQLALRPFVSNPRARISDARARGIDVQCVKRDDGQRGFRVVEQRAPMSGIQEALAL